MDELWSKKNGRRFTVVIGDHWGDEGKREIEVALASCFEAFVRVSGGANTGGTIYLRGLDGQVHRFVLHLVPIGAPLGKLSIIGHRVCVDLERITVELGDLRAIIGGLQAPLLISKRAPLALPLYSRLIEMWVERSKGSSSTGTTKRGISAIIAANVLRIGPQVGDLLYPDTLRRRVHECRDTFNPIFLELHRQVRGTADSFDWDALQPDRIVEELFAAAEPLTEHIVDIEPTLHDLDQRNTPTLFGMTQGTGLHSIFGTYPYNSATESTAPAASYCGGIPMNSFGPIIQVLKLFPTRVGNGPFPTHLWDRQLAEAFPKEHPELFTCLPEYNRERRDQFLAELREKANGDKVDSVDLATYLMVLQDELGATTMRGREIGWPDLYFSKCTAISNGTDCLALTRLDAMSGLKFFLHLGTKYRIGQDTVRPPIIPTPAEELERVTVGYDSMHVDFSGCDLSSITSPDDWPEDVLSITDRFEEHVGVPVGIISAGVGPASKFYRTEKRRYRGGDNAE